jgi:hypothetical protein
MEARTVIPESVTQRRVEDSPVGFRFLENIMRPLDIEVQEDTGSLISVSASYMGSEALRHLQGLRFLYDVRLVEPAIDNYGRILPNSVAVYIREKMIYVRPRIIVIEGRSVR